MVDKNSIAKSKKLSKGQRKHVRRLKQASHNDPIIKKTAN